MQKRHFEHMAAMVKAILNGEWTDSVPHWASLQELGCTYHTTVYERAVQTAEAFIILASKWNADFDVRRFLIACGLVEKPAKVKRSTRHV